MKTLIREAMGYLAASVCALAVDMSALWLLVHFLSWSLLYASTVSFLAGAVVAYRLSVKLAFRQHRLHDRRAEFLGFIAIGALGLAVNAAVIFVLVKYAGVHFMLAKCVAAACTFTCNFVARRQLLFVHYPSAVAGR